MEIYTLGLIKRLTLQVNTFLISCNFSLFVISLYRHFIASTAAVFV